MGPHPNFSLYAAHLRKHVTPAVGTKDSPGTRKHTLLVEYKRRAEFQRMERLRFRVMLAVCGRAS